MLGLVLGIVGGVDAGNNYVSTGAYTPGTLSKVSLAIFIVIFVLLVTYVVLTGVQVGHADAAETRLLFAIALSIPFILVRLVYSCISTIDNTPKFNLLTGSTTILLCMAVIMEIVVIVLYEAACLTLPVMPKAPRGGQPLGTHDSHQEGFVSSERSGEPHKENGFVRGVKTVGKYTIMGQIISRMNAKKANERDVEMARS